MQRRRFAAKRFDSLDDEPRCGAPRKVGDDKIADVVTQTLETMPSHATHWSTRSMAKASGLSVSTVHRIWNAFSLQPHRGESFKLSTDPQFVEKVRDIVGLYALTRRSALWCFASMKRPRSRPLDRTQPLLPMRPGQVERRTHDYERHGVTTLFAALDVKAGTIVGRDYAAPPREEFRKFLDEGERNVPADLDIHIVMDNASSHKTKLIRDWFAKPPPLACPLHTNILILDHAGQKFLRAPVGTADQAPGRTDQRPNSRARSTRTSRLKRQFPSRSSGPNQPTTFSLRLNAFVVGRSAFSNKLYDNFRIRTLALQLLFFEVGIVERRPGELCARVTMR